MKTKNFKGLLLQQEEVLNRLKILENEYKKRVKGNIYKSTLNYLNGKLKHLSEEINNFGIITINIYLVELIHDNGLEKLAFFRFESTISSESVIEIIEYHNKNWKVTSIKLNSEEKMGPYNIVTNYFNY